MVYPKNRNYNFLAFCISIFSSLEFLDGGQAEVAVPSHFTPIVPAGESMPQTFLDAVSSQEFAGQLKVMRKKIDEMEKYLMSSAFQSQKSPFISISGTEKGMMLGVDMTETAKPPLIKSKLTEDALHHSAILSRFFIPPGFMSKERRNNKLDTVSQSSSTDEDELSSVDASSLVVESTFVPGMGAEQFISTIYKQAEFSSHQVSMLMGDVSAVRLLVLDGGGVRGLIELEFLKHLEAQTGMHSTEIFHLMGGTSAGGQIVALLSLKDKYSTKPKYTAAELLDYFLLNYSKMFVRKGRTLFGLLGEKHKTTPIKKMVHDLAEGELFQDAIVPTFVTAYDLSNFVNKRLVTLSSSDSMGLSVEDVILATTAAPGYFKSHKAANGKEYIDGGLGANNPTLVGLNEAYKRFPHATQFIILSLGTGVFPDVVDDDSSLRHVSLLSIAKKVPSFFLRGQQDAIEESLLNRSDVIRFRFNPIIRGKKISLDDASPEAIFRLRSAVLHMWSDNKQKIEEFIRLIPKKK